MADYKCSEEMFLRCSNNALCHLCDGRRLFKDPIAEKKAKLEAREARKQAEKEAPLKVYKKEKKEGMAFEKRVASQWNAKFGPKKKKKIAKPRLDLLLDIEDEEEDTPSSNERVYYSTNIIKPKNPNLQPTPKKKYQPPEAKRQINSGAFWHSKGDIKLEHALMECKERGTTNSRGEKQITIPKLWLEKQAKEAFQEQRPYWYLPFGYKGDDEIYLIKPYDHEMELIYELRKAREEIERLQVELAKYKERE